MHTAPLSLPQAAPAQGSRAPGFFAFHGLMAPGVRLLRRLDIRMKLLVVASVLALPLALLGWAFHSQLQAQKASTSAELAGVDYARALLPLLRAVQDQRGLANRVLNGDSAADGALNEASARVDRALAALANAHAQRADAALNEAIVRLNADVAELQQGLRTRTAQQSSAVHGAIARAVLEFVDRMGESSGLVLDPEAASFYVMQAVVMEGAPALEALARTRAIGAGALSARRAGDDQRQALAEQISAVGITLQRQRQAYANAIKVTPELRGRLDPEPALAATDKLIARVRGDILASAPSGDAAGFWDEASRTLDAHFALADRTLDALADLLNQRLDRVRAEQMRGAAMTGAVVLLAVYFLYAFYLVISGGLHQLGMHILRLADGDFSARPWPMGRDEVADSLDKLRESLASMSAMVADIRSLAGGVSHAAQEIASGNQDLSSRTESSAVAVESTAEDARRLLAQLDIDLRSVAALDGQLGDLTRAMGKVEEGVTHLTAQMQALEGHSREIATIVGLIDGIAFQTNILALNASVEAARAGDSGRGFAVVAQEVRALAQRSAEAARQIADIVGKSTRDIRTGAQFAQEAVSAVGITAQSVQKAATEVAGLRASAVAQHSAADRVDQSMRDIAHATQSNAALVEQVAAATATLDANGRDLFALVDRFKLGH